MTANLIINYGFNQHLEGITRNDHENENVDWEALDFLLVDDFSVEEVKKGQVHLSTSSEDAINKLKDALSVERKKTTNNIALPRIHNPSGQSKRFKEVTEEKLIDLQEKRQSLSTRDIKNVIYVSALN